MPGFHGVPVNESNYNYDFDYRFYDIDYRFYDDQNVYSSEQNDTSENNSGYLSLYCVIY